MFVFPVLFNNFASVNSCLYIMLFEVQSDHTLLGIRCFKCSVLGKVLDKCIIPFKWGSIYDQEEELSLKTRMGGGGLNTAAQPAHLQVYLEAKLGGTCRQVCIGLHSSFCWGCNVYDCL